MSEPIFVLSTKLKRAIKPWIKKFPKDKQASAVTMALRLVQDEYGYLQDQHLDAVADFLKMPKIQVYEVASFYSMYKRSPGGKYVLSVCRSVSCYLRDADQIIDTIKDKLGIEMNETTDCGQFSLREAECLGACCQAPCMLVNDNQYQFDLTKDKTLSLLDDLKEEGG